MNCKQAHTAIALLVGDDLSRRDLINLRNHLQDCPECSAELDNYRQLYPKIADILKNDIPAQLPANFAHLVLDNIDRSQRPVQPEADRRVRQPFYIAAAVTVVIALLSLAIYHNPILVRQTHLENHLQAIAQMEAYHPEFRWDAKLKYLENLDGPVILEHWSPPDKPGLVAILHKPDPVNKPTTFVLDYCFDSRNISELKSYPWLDQRINRLANEAGSRENIFVAFYYLPNSTHIERNRIIKKLEKKYKANLFERKGM